MKDKRKTDLPAAETRETYKTEEVIREKFNMGALLRILRYAVPYKWYFIGAFILLLVSAVTSIFTPLITSAIISDVIQDQNLKVLIYFLITLFLIAIVETCTNFFHIRMLSKTGQKIVYTLRRDVFAKLQKLSFDYFDNRPTGKILVRVTNYINEIANFFANMLVSFILNLCRIAIVLSFMFALDWRLALTVIGIVIPLVCFVIVMRKILDKRIAKVRNTDSSRSAYLHENILGNTITNSFNRTGRNLDIYMNNVFADSKRNWMNFIRVNSLFGPGLEVFWNYGTMAIFTVAFFLMRGGTLEISIVIAFTSYMTMLSGPLTEIANIIQNMVNTSSYIERVFDLLDTAVLVQDRENAEALPPIVGNVDFEDVTFGYEKDIHVLERFDLHVKAGECIGLVGPTGAGKTTVINLISRFYDAQEGAVKIDGHDVKDVTLRSLRSQLGIMMQDTFIFKGRIIDNIRYGTPDATDEQCIAAAKEVFADEFISKMPKGYMTELSEKGEELSTGERQLISFARVILRNPRILILDEATSAIDTNTERHIQGALDVLLKGRTSFMVAHRLSTVMRADKILYIARGGIQEQGTHKELMEKRGLYYNLAKKH